MKKYYCSTCEQEKGLKDVSPKISEGIAFSNPAKPEEAKIDYPIVCRACGNAVKEIKTKEQ